MPDLRPILIVEDNADTREVIRVILDVHGFPTVAATNGREGLDALREHHPCLILLDLTMPIMNGWQFRDEQRRLPERELADAPVILVSALSDCSKYAREMGAVAAIPKPLDFELLVEAVRQHCRL